MLAICLFATVMAFASPAYAQDTSVDNFEDFKSAVSAATNDNTTITLREDIEFAETVTIKSGQSVTIVAEDDVTITSNGTTKTFFEIEEGAALTLDVDIDADGVSNSNSRSAVFADVEGTLTIAGGTYSNATLTQSDGGVFRVYGENAKMVITGGTITGNSFTSQAGGIIYVGASASLEMTGGTITNNSTNTGQLNNAIIWVYARTGYDSIYNNEVSKSTFTMSGGEISNNSSHYGAVMVGCSYNLSVGSEATFTMTGGTITGNSAAKIGGGVAVVGNGSFYMQGGTISSNTAVLAGGGVGTYDMYNDSNSCVSGYADYTIDEWAEISPARFEMTGGTITGNTASGSSSGSSVPGISGYAGCGGGVYVASNTCVISAGSITDNTAAQHGGGIYVASTPYVLHLTNVLDTGNTASALGGGLWVCPTGDAYAYITSGAAIIDNAATKTSGNSAGDDLAFVGKGNSASSLNIPEVSLTNRLLGGSYISWYRDGGITGFTSDVGLVNTVYSRYANAEDPELIDVSDITSYLQTSETRGDGLAMKGISQNSNAIELAASLAQVVITDNTATRGGGIASNGSIVFGDADAADYSITVNKEWADGTPDGAKKDVTVALMLGDYTLETVTLNEENGWTYTFDELANPASLVTSDGETLKYRVVELDPVDGEDGYSVSYGGTGLNDDGDITFTEDGENSYSANVTITNTYTPESTETTITTTKTLEGTDLSDGQDSGEKTVSQSDVASLPQTGDAVGFAALIALACASAGAVGIGVAIYRRNC